MNDLLSLEFQGPFGLVPGERTELFRHPLAQAAGIYLWAVPYSLGGFLPLYVGETSASVERRVHDHLIRTVGGDYRICDPDSLARGELKVLWDGLWRKGTRDRFPEYLSVIHQLLPAIRQELQTEVVFVAPVQVENRIRRRIEGAIATHIKAQPPPASSVFPTDVRYNVRTAREAAVSVSIRCASQIHGLPDKVIA